MIKSTNLIQCCVGCDLTNSVTEDPNRFKPRSVSRTCFLGFITGLIYEDSDIHFASTFHRTDLVTNPKHESNYAHRTSISVATDAFSRSTQRRRNRSSATGIRRFTKRILARGVVVELDRFESDCNTASPSFNSSTIKARTTFLGFWVSTDRKLHQLQH